jgi:hypothetical protein
VIENHPLPLEFQGSSTRVCGIKIGIVSRISRIHSYRLRPGWICKWTVELTFYFGGQ